MDKVELTAIGDPDMAVVQAAADAVSQILDVNAHTPGDRLALPQEAYNPKRRQYCSTDLLKYLRRVRCPTGGRCLGIADVDLYAPRLSYVFGEATLDGPVAVISLTRLRPEFYGQPYDHAVFLRRVIIEAVHELGHTYGLYHCTDPHCVMRFSSHIEDSDRKGFDFCPRCVYPIRLALRAA